MKQHNICAIACLALCSTYASAQVTELPEKVYVSRTKTEHRTRVHNVSYLDRIAVGHSKVLSVNDTLRLMFKDGHSRNYMLRTVDSLSFTAPDSQMRANLAYMDKNYTKSYPTYSDNYLSYSSWADHGKWELANVHDPTVMKAADGYYYMSQTDAGYGNPYSGKGHFYVRRSTDLVNWEPVTSYNSSCAMPESGPAWLADSINSVRKRRGLDEIAASDLSGIGYWAPAMRMVNDSLYRMYYSIVVGNGIKTGSSDFDNSWNELSWIGLMETSDPASGKWVDKGGVICAASDKGKDDYARSSTSDYNAYSRFNAIDPSYLITEDGEHWLFYGSWHSGIAAIQLDPATGKTLKPLGDPWNIGTGQTTTYGKLVATRDKSSRWQGSEGAEVVYNPETGYYYMFLAYDALDIPYNTRVVRSKNPDGPYYGMDGTNVTTVGGNAFPVVTHPYKFNSTKDIDGWVGISHCAVFDDGEGNWYFCSQGRKPKNYENNEYSNALMMGNLRRIYWTTSGWPIVSPERYGHVEDASIASSDLEGTWELINLSYKYGTQDVSDSLSIKVSSVSPKKLVFSGAIKGTATLKDNNKVSLTISGTTYEFTLARELDWEADKRQSTIVMAGYSSTGKTTYWGKKVK